MKQNGFYWDILKGLFQGVRLRNALSDRCPLIIQTNSLLDIRMKDLQVNL